MEGHAASAGECGSFATARADRGTKPATLDKSPLSLAGVALDDVFTGLIRGESGRAAFCVEGAKEKISVLTARSTRSLWFTLRRGRDFICFEPMSGPTNAFNLHQAGKYPELESIPPRGTWREKVPIAVCASETCPDMSHVQTPMNRRILVLCAALVTVLGCSSKKSGPAASTAAQPAAIRVTGEPNTIPAGTRLRVRTNEPINSSEGEGKAYNAQIETDVIGADGNVLLPKGSAVELVVMETREKGGVKGAGLRMECAPLRSTGKPTL